MKTLGDYVYILIGILGSLASIIAFVEFIIPTIESEEAIWAIIFLGIISIYFLIYNLYLLTRYRKKARYIYAFEDFNDAFAAIHSIDRKFEINQQEIYNICQEVCTLIAEAFIRIVGEKCGVCIKIIGNKNRRPKVITFTRDVKSSRKRLIGPRDNKDHWIDLNTDFNSIYQKLLNGAIDDSVYVGSYLQWKSNYQNTNLPPTWPPSYNFIFNFVSRYFSWPLKYRSTIVVPLVPLSTNDQSIEALRGFLCIDSKKNNAFNKDFDVEIMRGLADGLYNKIDNLYVIISDENQGGDDE